MSERQREVTIKITERERKAVVDFLGRCELRDSVALTLGVLRQIANSPKPNKTNEPVNSNTDRPA